jgi:hypothetical protein
MQAALLVTRLEKPATLVERTCPSDRRLFRRRRRSAPAMSELERKRADQGEHIWPSRMEQAGRYAPASALRANASASWYRSPAE